MTITHPELVRALAKPGAAIAESMTAQSADLLHHAVGVSGECGELLEALTAYPIGIDRVNLVEELGDLEFYLEGFRQNLGIERAATVTANDNEVMGYGVFTTTAHLAVSASKLLDLAKKVVIYEKEVVCAPFVIELQKFERLLNAIRFYLDITREETIEGNIAKLQVRYAAGSYSNQQAQTRADKADEAAA
ncbi:nucleoside triphosphate pyrophosphohydrolase [Citromicrobium phage vB_CbaS-RXM]|nr:nucleoside triphosphate pyrophosphohydrolase [Citromicrobium phage vB_CbaS-RXM]